MPHARYIKGSVFWFETIKRHLRHYLQVSVYMTKRLPTPFLQITQPRQASNTRSTSLTMWSRQSASVGNIVRDGRRHHRRIYPTRADFRTVTRSILGSAIASAMPRWYGYSLIGPGSALPAGKRTFSSIHPEAIGAWALREP
jgi:hypothetical protein